MGYVLGVTGDIGSGKSAVLGFLRELGAETLSADDLARDALAPGAPAFSSVLERFGDFILQPDGSIDRKCLGDIVFQDERARRDLEAIVHPIVMGIVEEKIGEFREKAVPCCVMAVEVPLLFESGSQGLFDGVLTVTSKPESLFSRLKEHRGMTRREAAGRLAAQLPSSQKASRSQHVICNDSDLETLRESVHRLWLNIACPVAR